MSSQANQKPERRIMVVTPDDAVRLCPVTADQLTVGRAAENGIVLDHATVSQRHARIDIDGEDFWVTDLDSEHGTFMGGIKLLPQVREQWRPDRALRIGEAYDLYLVENGPQSQQEEVQPAETSLAHTSLIGIACEKTEFVVTPAKALPPQSLSATRAPLSTTSS